MEFFPLCKSNHWVPRYPIDVMDSYEQTLWEFFTQTLSWGTSLHSRATFDFLINAKNFSKDRAILDAGAGYQTYSWSDGSSSQTIAAKSTGTYKVYVTNVKTGCKYDTFATIPGYTKIRAYFTYSPNDHCLYSNSSV